MYRHTFTFYFSNLRFVLLSMHVEYTLISILTLSKRYANVMEWTTSNLSLFPHPHLYTHTHTAFSHLVCKLQKSSIKQEATLLPDYIVYACNLNVKRRSCEHGKCSIQRAKPNSNPLDCNGWLAGCCVHVCM